MGALILASSSRYRAELLERLGLAFEKIAPDIDETPGRDEAPDDLVRRLARDKARAVAAEHPGRLVIGSDQVAVADGGILGKPGDRATAIAQLTGLSGRTVTFLTGLCVVDGEGSEQLTVVPTTVTFRTLSAAEIEAYVEREQPFDCAGSFRSEALGIALFDAVCSDDPTALIGLPLIALCGMLRKAHVDVLA